MPDLRPTRPASLALACLWLLAAAPAFAFTHIRQPVDIPMGDGMSLAADAYLPAEEGSWPAVLIQTPYNKNQFAPVFTFEFAEHPLLKNPDYAFVVMDWRGFYASTDAKYQGSPTLGEDGADAVEWIAAQPWSDGNVGTWGASALGRVQAQTAAEKPPHLKACVPIVYHYRDPYDLTYPGGVYAKNRGDFVYGYFFGGSGAIQLQHPVQDAFWTFYENLSGDPSLIDTPMLHTSGWYDLEPLQTIKAFDQVRAQGGPNARNSQWLLIGPWAHSSIGETLQGEIEYPDAEHYDSLRAVEFFDFYLRGIDNGWDQRPPVEYYRLNEQRWVQGEAWPPAPAEIRSLYLEPGLGLSEAPPASAGFLEFVSDPNDPAPTIHGFALGGGEEDDEVGPGDLSALLPRSDVLAFSTGPLAEPLTIEGQVQGKIWIETGAVDADIALRLVQVYPDGRWVLLVDGVRRASLRNGLSQRELLSPATPYEIPVEIWPVSATIPAGHQLGVILAPANYSLYDYNPQDGSSFSTDEGATPTPATIRVLMDPAHPSRLELPLAESTSAARESGWLTR